MNLKLNNDGLIPAIIQDFKTREVLMLGYMNQESYEITLEKQKVTFFSRSKQRIWTKGEESGNFLDVVAIQNDCDSDALLIQVNPVGPTCHTGTITCWGTPKRTNFSQIERLEAIITERKSNFDEKSYVSNLFAKGINKIAQKVGEEAVEVVIEAKDDDLNLFLNESADLFFHYLILLQAKGVQIEDVLEVLTEREK